MSKRRFNCDICKVPLTTQYQYSFKLEEESWSDKNDYKIHLCENCYRNMIQYCTQNIERSEKE